MKFVLGDCMDISVVRNVYEEHHCLGYVWNLSNKIMYIYERSLNQSIAGKRCKKRDTKLNVFI